jgi:hypothetical protein
MVSNKNAYEIRTEILNMAKTFVMDRFYSSLQKWQDSTDRHPDDGTILSTVDAPQYPSSNEILTEAKKLYSFVDSQ